MEEKVKMLEARVQALECMVVALIGTLDAVTEDGEPSGSVIDILEREAESLTAKRELRRAFNLNGLIEALRGHIRPD